MLKLLLWVNSFLFILITLFVWWNQCSSNYNSHVQSPCPPNQKNKTQIHYCKTDTDFIFSVVVSQMLWFPHLILSSLYFLSCQDDNNTHSQISDTISSSAHLHGTAKQTILFFTPPSNEESAAVKHSAAEHTNRVCSCIMSTVKHCNYNSRTQRRLYATVLEC